MGQQTKFEKRVYAGADRAKEILGQGNQQLLSVSERLVDDVLNGTAKWQDFFAGSMDKGMAFSAKQQDLFFNTLYSVRDLHRENLAFIKRIVKAEQDEKGQEAEVLEIATVNADKAPAEKKSAAKPAEKTPLKDLTVINGIGPKVAGLLKASGIQNLSDLANTSIDTIKKALAAGGARYKSFDPAPWVKEAKKMIKG